MQRPFDYDNDGAPADLTDEQRAHVEELVAEMRRAIPSKRNELSRGTLPRYLLIDLGRRRFRCADGLRVRVGCTYKVNNQFVDGTEWDKLLAMGKPIPEHVKVGLIAKFESPHRASSGYDSSVARQQTSQRRV